MYREDGYIYLLRNDARRAIKIGFSRNPVSRIASLRTASPDPLIIEAILPGSKRAEMRLRGLFDHCRLNLEWFDSARATTGEIIEAYLGIAHHRGAACYVHSMIHLPDGLFVVFKPMMGPKDDCDSYVNLFGWSLEAGSPFRRFAELMEGRRFSRGETFDPRSLLGRTVYTIKTGTCGLMFERLDEVFPETMTRATFDDPGAFAWSFKGDEPLSAEQGRSIPSWLSEVAVQEFRRSSPEREPQTFE